jgi:hypothetical protein
MMTNSTILERIETFNPVFRTSFEKIKIDSKMATE